MPDITATDAARRFSELLDAIEHDGSSYTVTRHGKAIAQITPVERGRGDDVKALLARHRPDPRFADDLGGVRGLLDVDHRP